MKRMKKTIISAAILGVPIGLILVGKVLRRWQPLYALGSVLELVGWLIILLALFAVCLIWRSIKCPNCGIDIPEPQKELEQRGIVKCPRCGIIIRSKRGL